MSTLNILMAATEAAPFLQTGDVASVVTGLTLALRAEDHDARIIIPYYRNIAMVAQPEKIATIAVQIADFWQDAEIYRVNYQVGDASIPVYLLRNQFYFERKNPYGYLDDYERFLFFSRTIVEIFKQPNVLPDGWRPNVIHGHDWMLGLLPSWMRYTYHTEFAEHPVAFVYTIHNASYQGLSVYRALRLARLEDVGFYPQLNEQANTINFLSRGALVADAVNTVSYQHADEIKKVWYARDLARALPKGEYFRGILNGLDYAIYDPSLDSEITRFNSHTLAKRQQNKLSAQQTFGLHKDPSLPLLGITSRLIAEKGMDLLEEIVPSLIEDDHVQLVVAGEVGDFRYQEVFSDFAMRYPSQLAVPFSVAEPQLRLLYGGADMLLVPSLYEPCGLQQMIAMRYGAVPVVHDTGGLHDTVQPWGAPPTAQTNDRAAHTGRGFVFAQYSAEALLAAIHQGLNVLRTEPRQWRELQRYNMEVPNFSWDRSVAEYVKLYELAIARCSEPRSFPQGKTVTMRSPAPPTNGDLDPSDALVHAILEIDELAMNIEQRDYYRRVARLVRELLRGDTVLIWETDEADQKQLILRECSSAEDVPEDQRADLRAQIGTTKLFTEQGNRSWQYLYPLRADISGPRARAGFLGSDLARCQGWKVQLAAPVQTHGRMIGAIDVFSRNETQQYDEHDISTLSALASALAVNLEKMHLSERATRLLEIDQTLSRAQTLRDALQVALEGAIRLAHASAGRIYLTGENDELLLEALQEFELPNRQPLPIDDQIPRQASILHEPDRFVAMYNLPLQLESATTRFSEIAIPIRNSDRLVGVLDVIKLRSGAFSQEDEELLLDLAGQIAGGIQNAREREALPQNYYDTLHSLSGALAGNRDMPTLMERIVNTIGEVLGVDAASLYLADERGEQLVIQAAYGYQAKLVGRGASYAWGEGVTGKIAQSNQAFRANSLDELRQAGGSTKGKYDDEQNSKRPRSFYGLSLNIPGREKAIGVLKVESLIDRRFSDEDVLLIQMMGNIIATVVYNTQLQRQQLNQLNANLHQLSGALAGSRDMPTLMERIVNTISEVLGVDAASLYLADERGERLVIQAAYGYQAKLVGRGASYAWGEGVTGKIAQSNRPFRANSLDELRQAGGSPKGKYDDEQNSKRPRSFYGLPLNIPGRERAIGVLKVESLIDRRFSDEDVLLIQMMGNIIATVVYNAQIDYARLVEITGLLGTLAHPQPISPHELLAEFSRSQDPTRLTLLARATAQAIGTDRERAFEEMIALGKVTVDPRLYALVAQSTTDKVIRREFELLYEGIRSDRSTPERFVDVATITHLWLSLEERRQDPTTLRVAVQRLVDFIAESFNAPATPIFSRGHWMGVVLDVHQIFENTYLPPHLGFIFYQGRRPEATDVQDLQDLSELLLRESKWKEPKLPVMVLLCGPDEDVSRTRDLLRNRLMGLRKITAITLLQMQQVIGSVHPDLALQRLVLAQIDLATISPYVTSGPLREAQIFFGRQAELHSISEHIGTTSFALIGNRKIGKTSILNRLHRALLPAVGFRTLFYSCEILEYARFLETPISGDSWQPDPPANAPATFGDLLDSPPDDRPFVLLLDEADALVRDDREHGWPIFSKIRQLADRGRLRVVLCGERILLEALFDPTGPHFNFANKLLLGPLDQKAVGNLVAQPMRGLGIDLRNENVIVTDIWNATAGHPNVVQHICNRLINRLNDRRFNSRHSKDLDRQQLTRRDVLAVVEAFDFLSQEFLPTYWGGATLLELIISLLLARAGQAAYTLLEVQQLVQDAMMHYTPGGSGAELKDLSAALDRLVDLRSILRRTPHGGYAFAFKAFPAAIVRPDVLLLDDRLAMYFEQFGKHGDITMRRS